MDVKGKKGKRRARSDINDMKIGGYGGDGTGVGKAETIVNLGHYYIDNYLPHLFSDWIWRRCEGFRKWRGYGLTGGHFEINTRTSKRTWKGTRGEWLPLREAGSVGGASNINHHTVGEHCEGRIWWVWVPSSAGGSVSDLGIGRLAGSGVDSFQGRNLTELPWSQRFHNTDKQGIDNREVFDPDVMSFIKNLCTTVLWFCFIVFCIWGIKRIKRWVKGGARVELGWRKRERGAENNQWSIPGRTPRRFDSNDSVSSESTSYWSDRRESIYSSGVSSDESTGETRERYMY